MRASWLGLIVLLLTAAGCAQQNLAPVRYGSSAEERYVQPSVVNRSSSAQDIIVRHGDTLYSLARRYGVDQGELSRANGLQPPYTLHPGERLIMPRSNYHVVRQGETLTGIARSYNVDTWTLADANGLTSPYRLSPGQRLVVSNRSVAPARASVASSQPDQFYHNPLPSGFIWPARGRVVSTFGPKSNGFRNDGINIEVREGDPVYAAQSGVVKYVGQAVPQYGNLILIEHDGRWISAYGHNRNIFVRPGDRVERGDQIALAGRTGKVASAQVHFELRHNGRPVDPSRVLGR